MRIIIKRRTHIAPLLILFALLASCTSTKNTSGTRWYHSFNTRYNVYFNGQESFNETFKNQQEGYKEDYSDFIYMYPVSSLPKDKAQPGGAYDRAIEKSVKAIKTHSIKTKPKKESGKRNDPKYQEFINRDEFNPFLHNAWMLMGKSQFYNGDFLQAASTFSYTARHFSSQPEIAVPAKIWQARCYSELEWYYEADDILSKINNDRLPKKESNWFSSVYADYLIKNKEYKSAIPYLQIAIKSESSKRQKARMKYLLGQIYTTLGENEMAYKVYGEIGRLNPPYELEFSAKIRQTEVFPGNDIQKVVKNLKKMAKSQKNKDYLDQVYYAMGNLYMTIPDTTNAIESYKLGVEKSTKDGLDKALCQIRLGDIYFVRKDYIEAQPAYSGALGQLKKEHRDYLRVAKRSEVLDELVVHYEAVHLQDSLQMLARLPESERLLVVEKIIADLKKKEEEAKKEEAKNEYLAQQEAKRDELQSMSPLGTPSQSISVPTTITSNEFYFYNDQAIALGKNNFQKKWGRRKLEDDWRRRSKTRPLVDDSDIENMALNDQESTGTPEGGEGLPTDSLTTDEPKEETADVMDPQFYLQQIPLTEEDMEASNLIIIDGTYNMGLIYKDKLEDFNLSLESFGTLDTRFPENEYKLDSYYQCYLIYLRLEDHTMAEFYKNKIRTEFPESPLAIAMADPDYEYNIKMMSVLQDSLYQATYDAYIQSKVSEVRKNYRVANQKYAQSDLMPKFMFLDALTYVQTNEPDTFKVRLKELIERYPTADVTVLAGEMMKGLQKGLTLSGDGNLAKGMLFDIRFGVGEGDSLVIDTALHFMAEKNAQHLLMLVYPKGSVNENLMLYNVAGFNFGNFMVNDFDLQFVTFPTVNMLQIKGFNHYDEVIQYYRMISQPTGYVKDLERSVIIIPISTDNYDILMKGKSLDDYTAFFEENYGSENPQLVATWKLRQEEEITRLSEEERAVEEEIREELESGEHLLPDTTEEPEGMPEQRSDSLHIETIVFPDTTITIVTDTMAISVETKEDSIPAQSVKPIITEEELEGKVNEAAGKAAEKVDEVNSVINEISEDPVRGVQNLFSRKKTNAIDEYVKQQEKEEKERQKQLKKEQQEKEKAEKELRKQEEKERKELLKKQQEEEKALLKEKEQQERDLKKLKDQEAKQKEDEKKRLQKEKEDLRKQKQQEYKDRQKQKEEERKEKEKARKEAQKIKDAERKAAQKQKEEERKARQKQREDAKKQRSSK